MAASHVGGRGQAPTSLTLQITQIASDVKTVQIDGLVTDADITSFRRKLHRLVSPAPGKVDVEVFFKKHTPGRDSDESSNKSKTSKDNFEAKVRTCLEKGTPLCVSYRLTDAPPHNSKSAADHSSAKSSSESPSSQQEHNKNVDGAGAGSQASAESATTHSSGTSGKATEIPTWLQSVCENLLKVNETLVQSNADLVQQCRAASSAAAVESQTTTPPSAAQQLHQQKAVPPATGFAATLDKFLEAYTHFMGEDDLPTRHTHASPTPARSTQTESIETHPHILCDGCDSAVAGVRWKCVGCADFDFCDGCYNKARRDHVAHKGNHHVFMAIHEPLNRWTTNLTGLQSRAAQMVETSAVQRDSAPVERPVSKKFEPSANRETIPGPPECNTESGANPQAASTSHQEVTVQVDVLPEALSTTSELTLEEKKQLIDLFREHRTLAASRTFLNAINQGATSSKVGSNEAVVDLDAITRDEYCRLLDLRERERELAASGPPCTSLHRDVESTSASNEGATPSEQRGGVAPAGSEVPCVSNATSTVSQTESQTPSRALSYDCEWTQLGRHGEWNVRNTGTSTWLLNHVTPALVFGEATCCSAELIAAEDTSREVPPGDAATYRISVGASGGYFRMSYTPAHGGLRVPWRFGEQLFVSGHVRDSCDAEEDGTPFDGKPHSGTTTMSGSSFLTIPTAPEDGTTRSVTAASFRANPTRTSSTTSTPSEAASLIDFDADSVASGQSSQRHSALRSPALSGQTDDSLDDTEQEEDNFELVSRDGW